MEDKIKKIMKEEFDAELIESKPTSGGYSHNMFYVKINKKPYDFIIRFSNLSEDKDKDLRKEIFVYEELKKLGIPVPKIILFRKKEDKSEHDYAIIEKLKGIRLDTIWNDLPIEEKCNMTFKIGQLMKKIHSVNLNDFGRLTENGNIEIEDKPFKFKKAGEQKFYSKFLRQLYRDSLKDIARLVSYEHVDYNEIAKIVNYMLVNKSEIDYKGKPILIHGDMIPGHIFVEKINGEYEITGLIDVEFAEPSCPEYDFIKLHRQGFFSDPLIKQSLIKGYGPINEKAVEVFRVMRDTAFAQVLFESGDNEFAEKILKAVLERINRY